MIQLKRIFNNQPLQKKVFLVKILIVLVSSLIVIPTTLQQYHSQAKKYREQRAQRKANSIKLAVKYILENDGVRGLPFKHFIPTLQKSITRQADIENAEIHLFNLDKTPLLSSKASDQKMLFPKKTVLQLHNKKYVLNQKKTGPQTFQMTAYQTISYQNLTLILMVKYQQNTDFYDSELENFIIKLSLSYTIMLMFALGIAYFFSKQITIPLMVIKQQLSKINTHNPIPIKIKWDAKDEIGALITSYNKMQEQLKKNTDKLITHEKSKAWKEMAKQIAHEIKNPLTPMRLSVQSFQNLLTRENPDKDKIASFCAGLLSQIDSLVAVSNSFSNFANEEKLNLYPLYLGKEVKESIQIFDPDVVSIIKCEEVMISFNKPALTQVLMNLIKNALQAVNTDKNPKIEISIYKEKEKAHLIISDNGKGIPLKNQNSIFEPNFTTKSSGTGLGLAIVKEILSSAKAHISVWSNGKNKTTFSITFDEYPVS